MRLGDTVKVPGHEILGVIHGSRELQGETWHLVKIIYCDGFDAQRIYISSSIKIVEDWFLESALTRIVTLEDMEDLVDALREGPQQDRDNFLICLCERGFCHKCGEVGCSGFCDYSSPYMPGD